MEKYYSFLCKCSRIQKTFVLFLFIIFFIYSFIQCWWILSFITYFQQNCNALLLHWCCFFVLTFFVCRPLLVGLPTNCILIGWVDVQTTNLICLGYYLDKMNIICSVIINKNNPVPIFIENHSIAKHGYILTMYQLYHIRYTKQKIQKTNQMQNKNFNFCC